MNRELTEEIREGDRGGEMSQFTESEWETIIQNQKDVVKRRDEQATRADEALKEHMTPHYGEKDCSQCDGTGLARGLLHWGPSCRECGGTGKVRSREPYYYSPGDPYGWHLYIKFTAPQLAREKLRQLYLRRFMNLYPTHPLSIALKEKLTVENEFPPEPCRPWESNTCIVTRDNNSIQLLNGVTYLPSTWGENDSP